MKIENSTILIVDDIQGKLDELVKFYSVHDVRIIKNEEKDEFLVAQANEAIKEAYISSKTVKYLFLCGTTFRTEAQNSLLKLFEEPPRNIVFIILTTSKSSILPTIYSRISYKNLRKNNFTKSMDMDFKRLDLKDIYSFLKQNQRISKNEAKELVETILFTLRNQNIKLNTKQLDFFDRSLKLLELNSKPINILTTLLLSLHQFKL
ncbi:MAG: DNA polymerase III subunit delta' [Sulfurovum sp.]|jgi:DNA polymerase-3 subunit delta'